MFVSVADREVDKRILQQVSRRIGNDWRAVGRGLGCTDAKLDECEYNHRHEGLYEVIYRMLVDWHERLGRNARLAVLAQALIDSKRPDVACELQDSPPR